MLPIPGAPAAGCPPGGMPRRPAASTPAPRSATIGERCQTDVAGPPCLSPWCRSPLPGAFFKTTVVGPRQTRRNRRRGQRRPCMPRTGSYEPGSSATSFGAVNQIAPVLSDPICSRFGPGPFGRGDRARSRRACHAARVRLARCWASLPLRVRLRMTLSGRVSIASRIAGTQTVGRLAAGVGRCRMVRGEAAMVGVWIREVTATIGGQPQEGAGGSVQSVELAVYHSDP